MTTIAWDGKSLAADQLITSGDMRVGYVTKIKRLSDGSLFGYAGVTSFAPRIIEWLNSRKVERPKDFPEDFFALQILRDCEVLSIDVHGITRLRGLQAIGNGSPYALAALECGKDARGAVEVALKFDIYSGGDIDVLEL